MNRLSTHDRDRGRQVSDEEREKVIRSLEVSLRSLKDRYGIEDDDNPWDLLDLATESRHDEKE